MIYRTSSPHPRRFLLKVVAGAAVAATALACSDSESVFTGIVNDAGADDDADAVQDAAPGALADAQPDVDSSGPVGVVPDSGTQ